MSDHDGLGPEGSYFEHKARREEEARRARGDAMFPVWITVLYLVLGFVFGLWHPGWLVFLTVPIHYMHFDSQWERLTGMKVFHHKTRKPKFKTGVPAILIIQLIIYFLFSGNEGIILRL